VHWFGMGQELCNKSKIKVNSFLAQNIILNLAQLASSLQLCPLPTSFKTLN
jgi:hypothetical protein